MNGYGVIIGVDSGFHNSPFVVSGLRGNCSWRTTAASLGHETNQDYTPKWNAGKIGVPLSDKISIDGEQAMEIKE
jgi:hypothetical protein